MGLLQGDEVTAPRCRSPAADVHEDLLSHRTGGAGSPWGTPGSLRARAARTTIRNRVSKIASQGPGVNRVDPRLAVLWGDRKTVRRWRATRVDRASFDDVAGVVAEPPVPVAITLRVTLVTLLGGPDCRNW
jgi:hypothetical protein